jgi:hypothetical protein
MMRANTMEVGEMRTGSPGMKQSIACSSRRKAGREGCATGHSRDDRHVVVCKRGANR